MENDEYTTEYWPSDKWLQKCKENASELKAGRMPNPYHQTHLMTIEEIVEQYGWMLSQEQIDRLKEMTDGNK